MLNARLRGDGIMVGERFSFTLQRTLRLPDDGGTYPLPPGFGPLPLHSDADYADSVPPLWRERGGFFVPMYQREATWLQFDAAWWKPNAVMVGVGGINAVSGEAWGAELRADSQNYLVCPEQPWLDGINAGDGVIRQFVAVPLGGGDTVEEQLTGTAEFGGIQLRVYEPRPGKFRDAPPPGGDVRYESLAETGAGEMGIAAGGRMRQKIYPDEYGLDTWDPENFADVFINIVNSGQYRAITGQPPPPTPVSPQLYTSMGLPWFALYDEEQGDVAAPDRLKGVEGLAERDRRRGEAAGGEDEGLRIDPSQVIGLKNEGDR
jgi:hypothetical protein